MANTLRVTCKGCGKPPYKISEYITLAKTLKCTPTEAVKSQEGTYDPVTKKFYCTKCYVMAGCPSKNLILSYFRRG